MSIGLVVDSTTDYPPEYYQDHDVTMVPLSVRFGEELYRDWVDIAPDAFFKRMRAAELPKTSQPTAGDSTNGAARQSSCQPPGCCCWAV